MGVLCEMSRASLCTSRLLNERLKIIKHHYKPRISQDPEMGVLCGMAKSCCVATDG